MRAIGRAVLLAALASGCALNASLEVQMTLPEGALPRARVEVCADCDFRDNRILVGEIFDLAAEPDDCFDGTSCNVRFSVVTGRTDLSSLGVRVRFCDSDCDTDTPPPGAPELWFELQEPFSQGRYTFWDPSAEPYRRVPADQPTGPPSEATSIGLCEIRDECWTPPDRVPDPMFGYCIGGARTCDGL